MRHFDFAPNHKRIRLTCNSLSGPFEVWYDDDFCGQVEKYSYAEIVELIRISARRKYVADILEPPVQSQ